jgi:hypothetical protein
MRRLAVPFLALLVPGFAAGSALAQGVPLGPEFRVNTPWDLMHVSYFNGYARWTYLNTPFFMAMPGFNVTEIDPWRDGSETWWTIA